MTISLYRKVVGTVILSTMAGSLAAPAALYLVSGSVQRQAEQEVLNHASVVRELIDERANTARRLAAQFAARPDVVDAVKRRDTPYVQKVAREVVDLGGISTLTIADGQGTVVGRGHSSQTGDSVLAQANVTKALAGEASQGAEVGTAVKFASAPDTRSGTTAGLWDR